jgi:type II secretory pathway predicted ATPase ExeA
MYHAHFALGQEPFGVSPDPRFFYRTEQHCEALATLFYAIEQRRGFALLVGHPGVGKTSVLVELVRMLEGKAEIAYFPQPYFQRSDLIESVFLALGLPAAKSFPEFHRVFFEYLTKLRLAGKTCVIIVDEAQELSHDTLEGIRMLSNFETPTEKLVQIILAGQPRLAEKLAEPESEQFRQRLNVVARLQPLSAASIPDYMDHRLRIAGGSVRLFTPEARAAIIAASNGVPRIVNTICFNSLTLSFALNGRMVGREEVLEVLNDLDLVKEARSLDARSPIPAAQPQASPVPTAAPLSFKVLRRSPRTALIAAGLVIVAALVLHNTIL